MINVFITGARGYIKKYAGWTALVHGLCENQKDNNIQYWIYETTDKPEEDGKIIDCENVKVIFSYVSNNNGMSMIKYDRKNMSHFIRFVSKNNIENPIILFLGLRIGPFVFFKKNRIKKTGAIIMTNAAGVEWKRPKWGKLAKLYIRISASLMARSSDYIICDAENIKRIYEKMNKNKRVKKVFIPYGSYPHKLIDDTFPKKVQDYFSNHKIKSNEYYLIINRFVPENSYELILNQFVKSRTKKDLVLVTNNDKEHEYYDELKKKIPFEKDTRIKFVGTMYDADILEYLRQHAFAYINGHTLGGTNPGLLEAMSSTGFVLAHNNVFSREVCSDLAIYYDENDSLVEAIEKAESFDTHMISLIKEKSHLRMLEKYNWNDVVEKYENLFMCAIKEKEL